MTIPADLPELTADVESFAARRGFDDIAVTLGLIPHAADGTTISLRMPLTEALAQASGMFSAAALFGAADITGTFLAMQAYEGSDRFPLAVQSNQHFLSNSKAEYAVATASVVRAGGNVAVVEVTVDDAHHKPLMRATFTYALAARTIGR
ncbi:PaaI family thioesterase [uncultured Microbacterium sp.]|uniref:PaaI family thioesterase n=1 Tax=uncultured Microbacterium sp. TaxID=191216 RepID=UPI0028D31148|nr:PaaI family thioesterase [uncultured Microbacterium sp.]